MDILRVFRNRFYKHCGAHSPTVTQLLTSRVLCKQIFQSRLVMAGKHTEKHRVRLKVDTHRLR